MRRLDVCLRCIERVILRAKFVAAENEDAISFDDGEPVSLVWNSANFTEVVRLKIERGPVR